jgi:signal transduction histidine kinase
MSDDPLPHIPSYTGGLSSRQFLAIVCSFWVFATLSDVLWAYGMRTGIARVTDVPLFAEWQSRVLQHLLLLPFLLVSFWASLRVQWRPLWVAAPLQIIVSNIVLQGPEWHEHVMDHVSTPFYRDATFLSFWVASFVSFLPAYGFGLALVTGLALYTRFQKSELHVAALELEWSSARLAALRMQLSPHTLFNLLHTIRGHIEWDPKGAQSMVVQLGDLLRRLLNAGERDFSRLTDELQFARLYLELQQRRFSDRLTVVLPETEHILAVWVPSLILQPLVENAVVHGLAGHHGAVRVRIDVRKEHEMLVIRVSNTIAENKVPAVAGIGIRNVRERLAVQFAGRAGLTAGPHGREWISEISLPEIHDSPDRQGVRRTAPLVGA